MSLASELWGLLRGAEGRIERGGWDSEEHRCAWMEWRGELVASLSAALREIYADSGIEVEQ